MNPEFDTIVAKRVNFKFGDDLEAYSASDFSNQLNYVLGNFRLLVFIVAAISAIVAGVGIINTMLMSVLERFKEIGALKAVGWSESDVLRMVLFESVFIGVFGGLVGIVCGVLISYSLSFYFGLTVLVTVSLLLWCFGFAVFLGLIAGIYPAWTASKLDPIEALRME